MSKELFETLRIAMDVTRGVSPITEHSNGGNDRLLTQYKFTDSGNILTEGSIALMVESEDDFQQRAAEEFKKIIRDIIIKKDINRFMLICSVYSYYNPLFNNGDDGPKDSVDVDVPYFPYPGKYVSDSLMPNETMIALAIGKTIGILSFAFSDIFATVPTTDIDRISDVSFLKQAPDCYVNPFLKPSGDPVNYGGVSLVPGSIWFNMDKENPFGFLYLGENEMYYIGQVPHKYKEENTND